jgi:hypothetical protein
VDSDRIIKVGKQVGGDLNSKFRRDFGKVSCEPAVNFVKLGKLAKDKGFIKDGRRSLQFLTAAVLKKYPPKDVILTQNQIKCAAMDAWASLEIFERLTSMSTFDKLVVFRYGLAPKKTYGKVLDCRVATKKMAPSLWCPKI